MLTVLNIALLILGASATLAAFGGETWRRPHPGARVQITSRGWLSLFCLLLALALGIMKEEYSHLQDQKNAAQQALERSEAERKQLTLQNALDRANSGLASLHAQNEAMQSQVVSARRATDIVSSTLSLAKQQLSEQGGSNLAATLASGNYEVSEVFLILPFSGSEAIPQGTDPMRLARIHDGLCRDVTQTAIEIVIGDYQETFFFAPNKTQVDRSFDDPLAQTSVVHYKGESQIDAAQDFVDYLGLKSWSHYSFLAEVDLSKNHISAAQAVAALSTPLSSPFFIQNQPVSFDREEYARLSMKYSSLLLPLSASDNQKSPERESILQGDSYSRLCGAAAKGSLSNALQKALLMMLISDNTNQRTGAFHFVLIPLKAQRVVQGRTGLTTVQMVVDGPPQLKLEEAEYITPEQAPSFFDYWPNYHHLKSQSEVSK